jgi:hypothetical protein
MKTTCDSHKGVSSGLEKYFAENSQGQSLNYYKVNGAPLPAMPPISIPPITPNPIPTPSDPIPPIIPDPTPTPTDPIPPITPDPTPSPYDPIPPTTPDPVSVPVDSIRCVDTAYINESI